MAIADLSCPICSADFPLAGDEKSGDQAFCAYCGTPCIFKGDPDSMDCKLEAEV